VQAGLWLRAAVGTPSMSGTATSHRASRSRNAEPRQRRELPGGGPLRRLRHSVTPPFVTALQTALPTSLVTLPPYPTRPDPYQKTKTPSPEPAALVLVTADAATARPKRPSFDDFWEPYPRKVGKDDARKAWDKATKVRKVDPAVIVAGAKRFAADPNLPGKQFIPHPSTWLARGGWDDEPYPATGTTGRFTNPGIPEGW
jgi:hypothetical protein